jgi:hypothetical protein
MFTSSLCPSSAKTLDVVGESTDGTLSLERRLAQTNETVAQFLADLQDLVVLLDLFLGLADLSLDVLVFLLVRLVQFLLPVVIL